MYRETEKRVEILRATVKTAKDELDAAKERFGANNDGILTKEVSKCYGWLNDIETVYIRLVETDKSGVKTLAEELKIVNSAELDLKTVTIPAIKRLSGWSESHGEKLEFIG